MGEFIMYKTKNRYISALVVWSILSILMCISASASILKVPSEYPTIQDAADAAADTDTILVADGVYTGPGNRSIDFLGKNFTLRSENGAENCTIDCEGVDRAFRIFRHENSSAVIDGFTITNGSGSSGGAIYCLYSSSPTIMNCIFEDNAAYYRGGAVCCNRSDSRLLNCVFRRNHSKKDGGACDLMDFQGDIIDCVFEGNAAAKSGGAIALAESDCIIQGTLFQDNTALEGGAVACLVNGTPAIGGTFETRCTFRTNRAAVGSDLYSAEIDRAPVMAKYNHFTGNFLSDYYVTPFEAFNLSDCTADLQLVTADLYVSWDGSDENSGLTPLDPLQTIQYACSFIYGTESNPVTIHIAPGMYSNTLSGEIFPLPCLNHVSLSGQPAQNTYLDAEHASAIFLAEFDHHVSLDYLELTDALGEYGSCFTGMNSSDMTFTEVKFTSSNSSRYCSGLYFNSVDRSVFERCFFSDNNNGAVYLYNSTDITISNTTISNNSSITLSGGIYITSCDAISIASSTLSGNTSENEGGAIHSTGYGTLQITDTSFNENRSSKRGGAIYKWGGDNTTLLHCVFTSNHSQDNGGAVYTTSPSIFTECFFDRNESGLSGGAVYLGNTASGSFKKSTFSANRAGLFGGAIFLDDHTTFIVGGAPDEGNTFLSNASGGGCDLFSVKDVEGSIDAQYNHFNGYHLSDYYVKPFSAFNLNHCISDSVPIQADLFVAPSGDDGNDGLSWHSALRTVQHALSIISCPDDGHLTVHVAPGLYSPTFTGERFPLPTLRRVHVVGSDQNLSIFNAESASRLIASSMDPEAQLDKLTLKNGSGKNGACLYLYHSELIATNCVFEGNKAENRGGAVYDYRSHAKLSNCVFRSNEADSGSGCFLTNSGLWLYNCLFTGHNSNATVYYLTSFSSNVFQCTFTRNFGTSIRTYDSSPNVKNCILWGNSEAEITSSSSSPSYPYYPYVSFCNVQGGYSGIGNINADPMFTTGVSGEFYLSQTESGQSENSPCLDTGSQPATELTVPGYDPPLTMSELTTRTDEMFDTNTVDMGYHYFPDSWEPTPSPTAGPPPLPWVQLHLSADVFEPGMEFTLDAVINNPGPAGYNDQPFVVLIDILGQYFWYPDWSLVFDYETVDLPLGQTYINILNFMWPEVDGQNIPVSIYGALLTHNLLTIFGDWDVVSFTWE
jgi:predicted outer membrane repeat protein